MLNRLFNAILFATILAPVLSQAAVKGSVVSLCGEIRTAGPAYELSLMDSGLKITVQPESSTAKESYEQALASGYPYGCVLADVLPEKLEGKLHTSSFRFQFIPEIGEGPSPYREMGAVNICGTILDDQGHYALRFFDRPQDFIRLRIGKDVDTYWLERASPEYRTCVGGRSLPQLEGDRLIFDVEIIPGSRSRRTGFSVGSR